MWYWSYTASVGLIQINTDLHIPEKCSEETFSKMSNKTVSPLWRNCLKATLMALATRAKFASEERIMLTGIHSVHSASFTHWWRHLQMYIHDDVMKWNHFPRSWPFVRGIHRPLVNSPHKGQWRGALMFSLIYARINGWVNNREAGDLRRHRAHYDANIMDPAFREDAMIWKLFVHNWHFVKTIHLQFLSLWIFIIIFVFPSPHPLPKIIPGEEWGEENTTHTHTKTSDERLRTRPSPMDSLPKDQDCGKCFRVKISSFCDEMSHCRWVNNAALGIP